jgi:hypothetical protein
VVDDADDVGGEALLTQHVEDLAGQEVTGRRRERGLEAAREGAGTG